MIKWTPSNNFLAQAGHLALGSLSVTLPYFYWNTYTASIIGSIVCAGYGALTEFIIDPWLEQDPFWWDGFEDLCFRYVGILLTWTVKFII